MAKKKNTKIATNKKKNNQSFSLFTIFGVIPKAFKFVFSEILNLIKGVGVGLFKSFDFIIAFIVSFFSYLFWGVKNISAFIWKYTLKMVFVELYTLIISSVSGIKYIASIAFYDFPMFLYEKSSKYVNDAYNNIKNSKSKTVYSTESGKPLSKSIRDYLTEKYENLSFVKEARERKEASLIILTINPNGDDALRSEAKRTYKYLARNKEGKLITGYFAALSRLDVYSYLIDEGFTVYEIETSWTINFFHTEASTLKRKMSVKDLVFWLAQLSTYIKAGIPLTEAVKVLAKQDKRRKYKGVYDSIIYELTMGESFSESLKKQGNVFPALLINMVKSAELIGDIEGTLDEMSAYYQEISDTRKAIVGALTYPLIILVFAIGVVIFMLVYIIPKFIGVYEMMNAEINPLTQATINVSSFLKNQYSTILLVAIVIIVGFTYIYRNLKAFKSTVQRLCMHLPVIGNLIIYKEMSLFARTFATLNKNNILLTDSIDILSKITNNEIYKSIMFRTINNLLKGEKMSESFKDHWAIPDVAYYMIVTGESTGELAAMLDKVGEYYQKLERNSIGMIKTFIEPVMIALLAVIVGLILVSVIVPMFGVYETITI